MNRSNKIILILVIFAGLIFTFNFLKEEFTEVSHPPIHNSVDHCKSQLNAICKPDNKGNIEMPSSCKKKNGGISSDLASSIKGLTSNESVNCSKILKN